MIIRNLYLFLTVFLTVYFQMILRWRMSLVDHFPEKITEKLLFIMNFFLDPFVISAFSAAALAAIFWMITLTKTELSTAYPAFLSLSFSFIVILSTLLLQESISFNKSIGTLFILAGLIFIARA